MPTEKEAAPEPVPGVDPLPFAPLSSDNSSAYPNYPQDQWDLLNNHFQVGQVPQQTSNPPDNLIWPEFELDQAFLNSLGDNQGGNIPVSLYNDAYTNSVGLGHQSVVQSGAFDNWNLDQRLFAPDFGHHVPADEDIHGGFSRTSVASTIPPSLHGHIAVSGIELPLPDASFPTSQGLPPEFWELGLLPSSLLQETEVTSADVTFDPAFGTPDPLTFGDQHRAEFSPSGTGSTPSTETSVSMSGISSTPKSGGSRTSENIDHELSYSGTQSNKQPRPLTFRLNVSQSRENTGGASNSAYTLQSRLSQFHTGRVRKQFSKDRRKEIAVTRGVGACFPCRMCHVTCRPNEVTGVCMRCCSRGVSLHGLCFRLDITDCLFYRTGSAIQSGAWQNDLEWSASKAVTLKLCIPKIPGAPQISISCRPFRPGLGDKVEDYVRGEVIGEKLVSPTYAACNTQALAKEIRSKARFSGRAYVDVMETENASALVVKILRGAFTFANEHPRSILNSALDLWSCTRMNAYDRSLASEETLGQEKVSDPSSPFFDIVPIPPKLDYQCDMVGIKWQNSLAELLMKVLWKQLLKKTRDQWLEVFLVVFVMLNNVEFVYGIGKELSEQYGLHAEDGARIQQTLSTYLERWNWSAKHLRHVYKTYFKGRYPFSDSELLAVAKRQYPTEATKELVEFLSTAQEANSFQSHDQKALP